jgi:hypothetical protein
MPTLRRAGKAERKKEVRKWFNNRRHIWLLVHQKEEINLGIKS